MSILENIALNMNIANNTSGTQKGSGSFANAKNEVMRDMAMQLLEALSEDNPSTPVVLTAQVKDILQNQLVLTLPDASQITGRTDTLLPLSIGDTASFNAFMSPEGKLTLSLLSDASDNTEDNQIKADNPLVKKALTAANIPANPRSMQVTSELLNTSQAVNANNIRKFITLSIKYPDIPIKELILLDANKVPLTPQNLASFNELAKGGTVWPSTSENILPSTESNNQPVEQRPQIIDSKMLALEAPVQTEAPNVQSADISTQNTDTISQPQYTFVQTEEMGNQPLEATSQPTTSAQPELPFNTPSTPDFKSASQLPLPIEPKDFSEEAVKKFYTSLKSATENTHSTPVKNSLPQEQAPLSEKAISEALEKTVSNGVQTTTADKIQFMQDINNVFPFIQIPVKLKEENAKGELYVFERKKHYNPDEPLTAVLHLELDSLGTTDIKVSLYRNKVSALFEVADSEAVGFFEEELSSLSERLSKLGFSLDSEFKIHEPEAEDKPLLYQFLEAHSPKNYSRYTFDVHA